MKKLLVFLIALLILGPKFSFGDPSWGHHGEHTYYHYHDHPRVGIQVNTFYPNEYYPVTVPGGTYYYDDGVYYTSQGGVYVVAAPPAGAVVTTIPSDFHAVVVNGNTYYTDNGVYYVHTPSGYKVIVHP